jgi:hypothetical protein
MKPPTPGNEAQRIAALREYRVLDTLPEQAYDDITRLAAQICGTPVALITLIDSDRQWFKSRFGLEERETPRDMSFCAHAILDTDLFEVPDATRDLRFADMPRLGGMRVRFYAGAPLVTADGYTLGTLCVADTIPRRLAESQQAALRGLARQTMAQLDLRRNVERLEILVEERRRREMDAVDRGARAARHHGVLMELARMEKSDLGHVLRTVTRRVAETLGVTRVGIWLFESDGDALMCRSIFDARSGIHDSGLRLSATEYPRYFAAMEENRAIVANDALTDPRTAEFRDGYLMPLGIHAMLDVPIWRDGKVAGIVCHEHTGGPRPWSREDQDFAVSVADMVSLALAAEERVRVQEALRASEASYRAIFDLSNDAIFVHDPESGEVVDMNRKAYEEHGYTREELASLPLGALSAQDEGFTAERLRQHFRRAVDGEPQRFEWRERTRDGRRPWKEVTLRLVVINGEDRLLATARDITDQRSAAEAIRRAQEDLERRVVERTAELAHVNDELQRAMREAQEARRSAEKANRAKSDFLSRMSHELRTPMNSILGFAQLLARKELPLDQRRAVDHILKAGRHLLNLINEVLDISRIETDRQTFSLEPVPVAATLRETLSLVRPLAAQRDCTIDDEAVVSLDLYVRADRQRLTQVMLNLLSNAVKYNRPGGTVHVTCELASGALDQHMLCIHVDDTGRGVPSDKLEQLFVPFERLGAEQSDVEGTGLGLALSRRLVEAMGGRIDVQSTPGVGSRFTVVLPLSESPLVRLVTKQDAAIRGGPPPAMRPAKLLYIEDNLANLSLVETLFATRPGLTLIPALQGQLGLDLAWEHEPDLILLDVHLPDMPGDEVLGRLRADARTARTPVIVISADAMPARSDRLLKRGAQAYLTKPLDVDIFLETVDRLLAERVP